MRKLLESGEFYKQARIWYNQQYLMPYSMRSIFAIVATLTTLLILVLSYNINYLFPLNKSIRYAIFVDDATDYSASITPAELYKDDTQKSIAHIFLKTYVERREGYNYDSLGDRMLYIQNTSTKVLYNKYNNYLSLDNPDSPVLRLQRYAFRTIEVTSINFTSDDDAVVKFHAISTENNGKILEDTEWEANISFLIDKLNVNLPPNSTFNFTVGDYKVKLIRDNNAK